MTSEPVRPIAGARIRAGSAATISDADGRFVLTLPAASAATPAVATVRVTVTADGFLEQTLDVLIERPADITMQPNPQVREEVDVSAPAAATALAPPTLVVAPSEVRAVAGSADNVFRVLQTLPGVSATDDFGSRLSVRGGGPDQNLTVMDGVEIHNPYRLFGLTSAFNPETIDRFELTAGGFGAQYGDRLSSILLVENRDGTTTQQIAGSTALSITDSNVVLEGKLPRSQTGSWLLTGRRTYYDIFAERVTHDELPSFNDLQTKVSFSPRAGHRLSIFALRSRENTDAQFTGDRVGDRIGLKDTSFNDVASASYSAPLGSMFTAKTVAAWYRYRDALDVDGSVSDGSTRANAPGDDAFKRSAIVFTRGVGVRDTSLRQEFLASIRGAQTLTAGVEAHWLKTDWGWTIAGDRNSQEANGSSVFGGSGLPSLLKSSAPSTRAGAWVEDEIRVGARAHIMAGVRMDWSGLASNAPVAPRLRTTIDLTPRTRLKIATGRYTQSPGYEKLLQADYFVDLSNADALKYEDSWHFVTGVEHEMSRSVMTRIEAYYKTFDQLIVGRVETPEETAVRVAQYNFPAALASSVPSAPTITTIPVNGASGSAYGFDVYLQKRARSFNDRLTGWVSYTWGKATIDNYGREYAFDYDRRHALSLVSTWHMFPRVDLGATLRAASGFPETTPVGLRVASTLAAGATEGAPGSLVPARDPDGLLIWTTDNGTIDNLNTSRLPVYVRLDLRMTYTPSRTSRWQFYVEVINALNRENAGALAPALQYDETSDRPRLTFTRDEGIPLLPSFGLRIRF